jgi:2,4-didehydro-3-deoxy-L-rhamnonate hydrolase
MKLIRFGNPGQEKPGVIDEQGLRRDCSEFGEEWNEHFFETQGLERLRNWLSQHLHHLPEVKKETRWATPFGRPSKIVCVGLNYQLHALESKMGLPSQPIFFMKATSAISAAFDPIIIPKHSLSTDYELELAVIIGKKTSYHSEESAMEAVAGYCIHNDVSERDFQLHHGGQWVKGKSADSFAPFGPYWVTKDEISDPHQLPLWLKVNGEMRQNSNTNDLIFKIPQLIAYISKYMTLLPGDIISTGTPAGVAMGMNPPQYLKVGDVVEYGIEGLGNCKQEVIAYETSNCL